MTPDGSRLRRVTLNSPADVMEIEQHEPMSVVEGETLYDVLRLTAERVPDRLAVIQLLASDGAHVTLAYRELVDRARRAANLFFAASEGAPPVVAVVAPYLSEALVAMWGGAIAGRYLPINPYLDRSHVAEIMKAAGATVLVSATPAAGRGVWDELDELRAAVPSLRRTFLIGSGNDDGFIEALSEAPQTLIFEPAHDPDSDCAFLHTGGTTASPKLVRHTHRGQILQGWLCGTAMGADDGAVIGHAMPNFHVGGAVSMMVRAAMFGQTLLTLTADGFRNPGIVPAFWDIAERFDMRYVTVTPTTAAGLLAAAGEHRGGVRRFTTGGAPTPPAIAKEFHRRFGLHLNEVWGGTEFHGILSFHYGDDVPPRLGSCGRTVPFHRVISAVLEGNRFIRVAGAGERGVLIASGPTLTPGFANPADDAKFFIEEGPDGVQWATTGDIGVVDDDEFIWILGREKDVIIRGGHNIDSALIDEALAAHPAVLHAAAVGRPCASKGELPAAYVELRPGLSATADELLDFARERISERAAVPVEIHVIEAMPMTAVGKVSKPALRLDITRRVAAEIAPNADIAVIERGGRIVAEVRSELPVAVRVELDRFPFHTEYSS